MARVNGGLFSLEASGSIGHDIVYAKWKQTQYVRAYAIPSNPNTTAQQVIRGYFQNAVSAWEAETSPHKALWNTYASDNSLNMSGFNFYMSKYVKFLIANAGTPPTNTITPPTMS